MSTVHTPWPGRGDVPAAGRLPLSAGMLRIEARRSIALLFLPVIAGLAWWVTSEDLPRGVALWPNTVVSIRFAVILVGPLMAGLSAWVAGRNKRRGMDELLSSTPRPAASRELAAWAATAAWGLVGYGLAAAYYLGATYLNATWGSPIPYLPTLLTGPLALLTASAIGYAAGAWVPSRFTTPLAAVGMFGLQGLGEGLAGPMGHLSPIRSSYGSVYYRGLVPDLGAGHLIWLAGLLGVALALVVLKTGWTPVRLGSLLISAGIAAVGAALLLQAQGSAHTPRMVAVPYEPACVRGQVRVCVHPAYEKLLPRSADVAERVMRPLNGIPGAPTQLKQRDLDTGDGMPSLLADGTLTFTLANGGVYRDESLARAIAQSLVQEDALGGGQRYLECTGDEECARVYSGPIEAQNVVGDWLYQQAGFQSEVEDEQGGGTLLWKNSSQDSEPVLERFAALDPAVRRAWLEENYAALRAGKIEMKDLP